MVSNFTEIESLLDFQSDDDFYFVQIIQRVKEHPELGRNNVVLHTYYIRSIEQLEFLRKDIIHLCDYYNARAYINLNVRSFKKVTCQCVREFAQRVCDDNYIKPQNIFNSVVGSCGASRNKTWLIDIDDDKGYDNKGIRSIINFIDNECEPLGTPKFIACLSTKNGRHLITKPFNIQKFASIYTNLDVHKNNPTILYVP